MTSNTPPPPRLWVVRATQARVAAVFRRGPANVVQVSKWSLDTDVVEYGQWLKGRIYERRCDLSPSGEYLVYFAANHRPPHGTWTAISRLPWLTALGFWPKGDTWGGGGVFLDDDSLRLNQTIVNPSKFARPKRRDLTATPFATRPGSGEDDPIHAAVLAKSGWSPLAPGADNPTDRGSHEKTNRDRLVLRSIVEGYGTGRRGWYDLRHRVLGPDGREIFATKDFDWADWDDDGDLLFATDGCLMRLARGRIAEGPTAARLVADLGLQSYDPQPSPARARRW